MNDLISEFLDKSVIDSLSVLLSSADGEEVARAAETVAGAFGSGELDVSCDDSRLVESFRRNLSLLVEKTWVEQQDVSLKEEVLYKLGQFCELVGSGAEGRWKSAYASFIKILNDVVYLMFGAQARSADFGEYALRIDPEFGIFWWYVRSLPAESGWSDEKSRAVELVAMFFLANY